MNDDRVIAVCMLASGRNGTLYTGVSSSFRRRIFEHRIGKGSPFTRKYGVTRLVWFEMHDWLDGARLREKRIKGWRRAWKLALIECENPGWNDLYWRLT